MPDRIEFLKSMISKKGEEPFLIYALALEHRGRGEQETSIVLLQGLVKKNPEYVPSHLMLGQLLIEAQREEEAKAVLTHGIRQAEMAKEQKAVQELQELLQQL